MIGRRAAAAPRRSIPGRGHARGDTVLNALVRLEKAIVFACSLFLAAAFCVIVLLRYGFESDLFAYEEWVLTVAFLLYFVGGGLASHGDVQIKADIVQGIIGNARSRSLFQAGVLLFEGLIAAVLTWYAYRMFVHEFVRWPNIPTTPVYKIPLAVPRFFILAGFSLMALHALVNGIRHLRAGLDTPPGPVSPATDDPSVTDGANRRRTR